jgi:hypothetical protein
MRSEYEGEAKNETGLNGRLVRTALPWAWNIASKLTLVRVFSGNSLRTSEIFANNTTNQIQVSAEPLLRDT